MGTRRKAPGSMVGRFCARRSFYSFQASVTAGALKSIVPFAGTTNLACQLLSEQSHLEHASSGGLCRGHGLVKPAGRHCGARPQNRRSLPGQFVHLRDPGGRRHDGPRLEQGDAGRHLRGATWFSQLMNSQSLRHFLCLYSSYFLPF